MFRSRWLLVVLAVMVCVIFLAMYSLESPPSQKGSKLVANFDRSQLEDVQGSDSEALKFDPAFEEQDGNNMSDVHYWNPGQERRRRKNKRRKSKVRNSGEDYIVDTEQLEEERGGKQEVIQEQQRQVKERNKLEKLKLEVEEDKKKLHSAWAKLEAEQREVKTQKESVDKKIKMAERDLKVEKQYLKDEKEQLQHDREELKQAPKPGQDNPTEDPMLDGLNSSEVRARFPGITFLPDYKLQTFLTPDPRTHQERHLEDISEYEAEERFYSLISTRHINCAEMRRMGNSGDGGWDICESEPYRPKKDCLVYSFGINNDFSFDDAMAEHYGCHVKAFDPSMDVGDHKHSKQVWFYQLGLGAANTINEAGWRLETLGSILSKAHQLKKPIDVLKIDIEYNEWRCFRTMFKEGVLHNVRQLVFEIHTSEIYTIKRPSSVQDFYDMAETLLEMERLGFRRFHFHYNPLGKYLSTRSGKQRTCCYELSYVNMDLIKSEMSKKNKSDHLPLP